MSGRAPLPPPQPPKPSRPPFRPNYQKKRKRPADDDGGDRSRRPHTDGGRPPRPAGGDRRRPSKAKKPKQTNGDTTKDGGEDRSSATSVQGSGPKKAKAKAKKSAAAAFDEADLDYDRGLNRAVGRMDATTAAAYLARQTKRYGRDLSEIELVDLAIGADAIQDTSSYTRDRTLDNLADFLEAAEAAAPTTTTTTSSTTREVLQTAPRPNGAPHTIVVTGAGLRAADLVRALRSLQTSTNTVAKLFAKHIKITEAIAFLQSHRTGIAVGTPARLIDLLDAGALSIAHLRRIVVDASHIDQKKRGVLDMPDTALPVARWLARPEFTARYGQAAASDDAKPPLSILFY